MRGAGGRGVDLHLSDVDDGAGVNGVEVRGVCRRCLCGVVA